MTRIANGNRRLGLAVTRVLQSPIRPRIMRQSLGLALLLVWYSTSFRVASNPSVTIPFELLAHPRQDAAWLGCLLATAITSIIAWGCYAARKAMHHRTTCSQPDTAVRTLAISLFVSIGTAISIYGASQVAVAFFGGILAGVGFALLVRQLAITRPPLSAVGVVWTIVCALGVASLIEAAALLLSSAALQVLISVIPILVATCLVSPRPKNEGTETKSRPCHGISGTYLSKSTWRSRIVTVLFCFFGLGLFMGIIGFGSDGLSADARLANNLTTSALGGLIGCVALMVAWRLNHDGPFVLTPVLLGTAALMLPFAQTGLSDAAHILGKAVNDCSFLLATICIMELSNRQRDSQTANLVSLQAKTSALVGSVAGIHVSGILLGGVLMTLTSLDITALSLVGASLVYLAMLALGFIAQHKGAESYIIVRNPQDVARIAAAQARAIAFSFPGLSKREIDVLEFLLQHQTIDRIAEMLGISRNTVKSHISHIYAKTGLNSRQQLIDFAATQTVALNR